MDVTKLTLEMRNGSLNINSSTITFQATVINNIQMILHVTLLFLKTIVEETGNFSTYFVLIT